MDQTPLVTDEIDAGKAFLGQLHAYMPVKAACWLRGAEGPRYLYVALDGLTVGNTDAAYAEVSRIARGMTDHYIDPFRVKLILPTDRIAKALTDHYGRFAGRKPPTSTGSSLGGVPVEEVYIYPPLPPRS